MSQAPSLAQIKSWWAEPGSKTTSIDRQLCNAWEQSHEQSWAVIQIHVTIIVMIINIIMVNGVFCNCFGLLIPQTKDEC